ncbi:MAG: hypothetical protein SCJ97_06810 [Bacillota bacterium]|nr:hypothetical protein [Bacillota bacterium]
MIIDWYTVIFQIVNFLVLVFLLRYFLYGPIIKAMDDREGKIVQREKEAETQKTNAEKEAKAFRQKSEELDNKEEEILEKARQAVDQEKRKLLDQARSEVDETKQRWEEALEREKESFISELRRKIGRQACTIARRCLQDLADTKLEELTLDLFLRKFETMSSDEVSTLKEAVIAEKKINLRSAFKIPEKKMDGLERSLKKMLTKQTEKLQISVKEDPDLICGLELEAEGYRIAWNIDSYLEDVEEELLKELDQTALTEKAGEVQGGGTEKT